MLRANLHYSQRDMAEMFGVTAGAIAMWENGDREIPGPALVLLDRMETDFGSALTSMEEADLQDQHLSRKFSTKILLNAGYTDESTKEASLNLVTVHQAVHELVQRHLSPVGTVRRAQVSLLEKAFNSVADVKGLPLKIFQLAGFFDLGLSHSTREMLVKIQSSLTPMQRKHLNQVFIEEFGKRPEEIFAEWNDTPIAIASIGQVHEAVLPTGERVAVKVQYPGIYRKVVLQSQPLQMLSYLLTLFRPDSADLLRNYIERLKNECDYTLEARAQEACRLALQDDRDILVPRVHFEYSGARVLTSDFIAGKDFRTFCKTASQEERNLAGGAIHRFLYKITMHHRMIQGDPHPGNFLFADGKVAFIDYGRIITLDENIWRNSRDFFNAVHQNKPAEAEAIMRSSGQILESGTFDFNEFWEIMRKQLEYELSGKPVKFTHAHVKNILRLGKSFEHRNRISFKADFFWPVFTSLHLWHVLADLEAEYVWRENIPFQFDSDTKP